MSSTLSARPLLTQSVNGFLSARPTTDLIERWTPDLETQVNVFAPIPWEPVHGRPGYFTDGVDTVGPLRIPTCKHAYYPLDEFASDIGTTGFDYVAKRSRSWGFDFDGLVRHADGLTPEQLEAITERAKQDPRCEVRKSTGGDGLHIYCHANDTFPADNHDQHAAYAKRILYRLAEDWQLPLDKQVDCAGGNMWFWSRRATSENQGLTLIKAHEQTWTLADLPELPASHYENERFETERLPLDAKHKAVLEALQDSGYATRWDEERGCLIAHTAALQSIPHVGPFETVSTGAEPHKPNCCLFPRPNGAWEVYRWRQHSEHESWTVDDHVHTAYNRAVSFDEATERAGLTRLKGAKYDATLEQVAEVARLAGLDYSPPDIAERDVTLFIEKGTPGVTIPVVDGDPQKLPRFGRVTRQRQDCWERMFGTIPAAKSPKSETPKSSSPAVDHWRRCYSDGKDIGWLGLDADGKRWQPITRTDAKAHIINVNDASGTEAEVILSQATINSWEVVSEHFAPEFPRPRVWNLYGAQFSCQAADHDGDFPHFELPLKQWGDYLTPYVARTSWLTERGIRTGRDYLFVYLAMILRDPRVRLPWLFGYGPQDAGKSSLFLSWASLMTKGAKGIDRAFRPGCQFNYELWGVILGAVEETNLSEHKPQAVHDMIKPLVSGPSYKVEFKQRNSFDVTNCLHVLQTANFAHFCPITERDDTRFVVVELPALGGRMVGEDEMQAAWKAEAPYFLRALTQFDLVPFRGGYGKLALPIVDTPAKVNVMDQVARLTDRSDSERSFASAMLEIESQIVALAGDCKLCGVTATEMLAMLNLTAKQREFFNCAEVMGSVLRFYDRTKLHIDHTRRNYHVTCLATI